jgi:hypothetical protein
MPMTVTSPSDQLPLEPTFGSTFFDRPFTMFWKSLGLYTLISEDSGFFSLVKTMTLPVGFESS